jgi:hypothetical protein
LPGAFGLLASGTLEFVNCDVGNLPPFGFVGFGIELLGLPEVPEPVEPEPVEVAPLPSLPRDLIYATKETSCSSVTCPLNVGIIG